MFKQNYVGESWDEYEQKAVCAYTASEQRLVQGRRFRFVGWWSENLLFSTWKKQEKPEPSQQQMQCGSLMYVPKKNVTPCGALPIRYKLYSSKDFYIELPILFRAVYQFPKQTDKTLLQTSVPGLHCVCKCVCNSDFLYRVDCHSVYRHLLYFF